MAGESALTDFGTTVGNWNALVRRARLGRERKSVALVVSSYADADGTSIHCGVARLAVDCEIGYSTARRYLAWLRNVGLIELVRHGNQRKGLSDVYRLILGPDLLEHIELPDPEQYDALKDQIRDANRAGQKCRRARDQRSPETSAETEADETPSALTNTSAETDDQRSPGMPSALTQGEPPPPLYTSPEELTSPKTMGDVRTDVAVTRATQPEDPDSDVVDQDLEPSPFRVIAGNPDAQPTGRGIWPAPVPDDEPTAAADGVAQGHGFCVPCYRAGQTVLAADPDNGSACAYHLRSAS